MRDADTQNADMRDAEIVTSIAAGEAAGLAAAYDGYAPRLYAYCRSLLGEPADAGDAVQDTFILATVKLGGLRDPGRLRPWLYAVARNECRHRLRSQALSALRGEAGEVGDDMVEGLAADAETAEVRASVGAALAGLSSRDREIIELNLRHGLEGPDLADALGVSENRARAMALRARSRFDTMAGALLVVRAGRESCPELAGIVSGWDGRLEMLLPKQINRHSEHCEACEAHRHLELSLDVLLTLLPVALPPVGLRDQVLRMAGDDSPAASAYRAGLLHRAGPFSQSGFPEPLDPPHGNYGPPARAMTAVAVAVAVFAAVAVFSINGFRSRVPAPAPIAAVGRGPLSSITRRADVPKVRAAPVQPSHPASGSRPVFPSLISIIAGGPATATLGRPPVPPPRQSPSTSPSTSPTPTPAPPTDTPTPAPPPPTDTPAPPPPTDTPTPTDPPPPTDPPSPTDTPTATATPTDTPSATDTPSLTSAASTLAPPGTVVA